MCQRIVNVGAGSIGVGASLLACSYEVGQSTERGAGLEILMDPYKLEPGTADPERYQSRH